MQIRPEGRNCFAFKGARDHLRFYFRKPAFEVYAIQADEMSKQFPRGEWVQDGEFAINISSVADAERVISTVVSLIKE